MGGNLNFGAHQLHFDVGGEHGFHLHKDPQALYIRDHDGHVLMTFGYGRIPTVYGNAPIATATPPAVYDLPLAAGITPYLPCKYWKTQDNEVKTLIRVSFTTFSNPLPVATLPEGYRPRHAITVLSQIYSQSGATQAHADLSQSGDIWLYQDGAASGNGSAIIEPFCFVSA